MTEPVSDPNPPAFAEAVLRLFLKARDRDCVSGDLLEEYREMISAGRNRVSADRWYLRQSVGFAWRAAWPWGTVIAVLALGRLMLDVFVPPGSFYVRSLASTSSGVSLYIILGFRAVWRGREFEDAVTTLLGAQIVAVLLIWAGNLVFLGIWHDPQTLTAIEQSGGIAEGFALPVVLTAPAIIFAGLGGAVAMLRPRPR